jgi:stage II sporulation protein D
MGINIRNGLRLLAPLILLYPLGCTSAVRSDPAANTPHIRVKLISAASEVTLACGVPPLYQLSTQNVAQPLNSPANAVFTLSLSPAGWIAGNANLGGNYGTTLHIAPTKEGTVSVNNIAYRGRFRFIPVGGGKFDVINDLDVDSYLAGVVAKECLPGWADETYKAQAIIARTYALYEKNTAGLDRYWDVWPDTKSQVYGGIPGETAQSRASVAETAGIVVANVDGGGTPRIFKAYFSSCCGGISQSASDAFGDPYIDPLTDANAHSACRNSPRFNWGPIDIGKETLTARFREYGRRRNHGEQNMATIKTIEIQAYNRWGRPIRFLVTDVKGNRYSFTGEEFRWAVDTNATENTVLYSSFVKVISDSDRIRFVEGHGWGHGVGMCQWCAQARAEAGLRHEDIVLAAYPTAVLVRAY